jgi:hypothetical protein
MSQSYDTIAYIQVFLSGRMTQFAGENNAKQMNGFLKCMTIPLTFSCILCITSGMGGVLVMIRMQIAPKH